MRLLFISLVGIVFFPYTGFSDQTNAIMFGETVSGTVSESKPMDYYSFTAQAGESVTILAGTDINQFPWPGFQPLLELYKADGTLLATNTGSTGALIRTLNLADDGNYLIVCRASTSPRVWTRSRTSA